LIKVKILYLLNFHYLTKYIIFTHDLTVKNIIYLIKSKYIN
jgi:hypothetical protein